MKENKYFEELFNSLAEEDSETGEKHIWTSCESLDSPKELKEYMFSILKSNMQYDFHIDFNDEDVIKFAVATLVDYLKDKNVTELKDMFDYSSYEKLSGAFDCELSFGQLKKPVSKKIRQRIYDLAKYIWLKDETNISINAVLDAFVVFINNGEKIDDLEEMSKWDLLEKVHDLWECY